MMDEQLFEFQVCCLFIYSLSLLVAPGWRLSPTASAGSQVRMVSRVGGFQSWIWGAPSRCRIFQLNSFHCLIVNFCRRSSSGLMLLFERARGREEIFSFVFEEGRSIPSCKVVFILLRYKLCYQSVCVPHLRDLHARTRCCTKDDHGMGRRRRTTHSTPHFPTPSLHNQLRPQGIREAS